MSPILISRVGRALNGYRFRRSAFRLVLLVPQGVVEIDDTLTEGATPRGDAHIGAGQTRLRPIILIGARVPHDPSNAGNAAKEQTKMMRDMLSPIWGVSAIAD